MKGNKFCKGEEYLRSSVLLYTNHNIVLTKFEECYQDRPWVMQGVIALKI